MLLIILMNIVHSILILNFSQLILNMNSLQDILLVLNFEGINPYKCYNNIYMSFIFAFIER